MDTLAEAGRTTQSTLRRLVDKWLAPTPAAPARVIRFSRMPMHRRRYVCIETSHSSGTLSIFFFRHDDGSWCVFPPAAERPAMLRLAS
ncbi:hypothetical protein FAZ95_12475 [Trinickia violacea]|uniref:Uncharacterized protein n=1 Tax=Trinickia violacea TaxID=2571746 RepID=A0A4P8ILW4_9BURK|nr:hypothetical protein [Trinickia violacea]QCP49918.1 hypothetical protein FAZ95_12475 [Trinickia violacea]